MGLFPNSGTACIFEFHRTFDACSFIDTLYKNTIIRQTKVDTELLR
jgi:hypothetical protein